MTGGVPDDGDQQAPADRADDGHRPSTMGRVTPLQVAFVTLVLIAIVIGIVSLFYGGLPSDG